MSGATILVVDDEPQIRRTLRTTLSNNGYMVIEARNGEQALETLREERPELVLLDVNMPGLGGVRACREIRERSDVAIIMLTVRDTERDKIQALDAGADDYVVKPFSMDELISRIRAALRRTSSTEPLTSFVSNDLEIDFERRHVLVQDRPVRLTPKEFELLRHLVASQGKPLEHRRLLQMIWRRTTATKRNTCACLSTSFGRKSSRTRRIRSTSTLTRGLAIDLSLRRLCD